MDTKNPLYYYIKEDELLFCLDEYNEYEKEDIVKDRLGVFIDRDCVVNDKVIYEGQILDFQEAAKKKIKIEYIYIQGKYIEYKSLFI